MPQTFDERRGLIVAVEGRNGENDTVVLAGDRPGPAFVGVEVEPQTERRRQQENKHQRRHRPFPLSHTIIPLLRRLALNSIIRENGRRHKYFALKGGRTPLSCMKI